MVEIRASYSESDGAREAMRKLQALRVFEVKGLIDSGLLTASVDEEVAERARHLIEQTGGIMEGTE